VGKKRKQFKTIDEYIASFPKNVQGMLERLRQVVKESAPKAEESINYGIPTFKLNGKNLVHFAVFKNHIGFYPTPSAVEVFKKDLSKYKQGKGSVQFPINKPIPFEIISEIVKFRAKGVKAEQTPRSEELFHVEREYKRCIAALKDAGILSLLPISKKLGVIGVDGKEYPVPTKEQLLNLLEINSKLIHSKILQGFMHLLLTPMSISIPILIDRLKETIIKQTLGNKIYQTRRCNSDPLIPARVNAEKPVLIWETLRKAIEANELVYFPQEYSSNPGGQNKFEIINNGSICAVPGWSVGLVESLPFIPEEGKANTLGGRKQLTIGFSPREYLRILHTEPYQGETGKTIEDFITEFLIRLTVTNEVSNDRYDDNALWLLGQYLKMKNESLVPTGWWHRDFGWLRLDAHRTRNKLCTRSWGASTVVRIAKF